MIWVNNVNQDKSHSSCSIPVKFFENPAEILKQPLAFYINLNISEVH